MRLTLRRKVDLPQPEGPIMEVMMPCLMSRLMSNRAWNVPYQRFMSPVLMARPVGWLFTS